MEEKNKGKPNDINPKQKIFCEEYAKHGNGTLAYRTAYPTVKKDGTAKVNASKLLTNTNIKKHIESLSSKATNSRIMSIIELREFWSDMARDTGTRTQERLKASELLGKSNGAFLERVEHSVDNKTITALEKIEDIVKKRFNK